MEKKELTYKASLKEYENKLNHLILMAVTKGWKDYAWNAAKNLDAHPSGLWRGISNALVMHMKNKK